VDKERYKKMRLKNPSPGSEKKTARNYFLFFLLGFISAIYIEELFPL
tara:strand:+ start:8064 stop:8204 length:141 start_codon:yes stop_codon:yes gene_type:complete